MVVQPLRSVLPLPLPFVSSFACLDNSLLYSFNQTLYGRPHPESNPNYVLPSGSRCITSLDLPSNGIKVIKPHSETGFNALPQSYRIHFAGSSDFHEAIQNLRMIKDSNLLSNQKHIKQDVTCMRGRSLESQDEGREAEDSSDASSNSDKKRKSWKIMLSAEQAVEIYKQLPADTLHVTSKSVTVGKQFGVSAKTIRDIWKRETWVKATREFWSEEDELRYREKEKQEQDTEKCPPGSVASLLADGMKRTPSPNSISSSRTRGRPKGVKDSRPRKRRFVADSSDCGSDKPRGLPTQCQKFPHSFSNIASQYLLIKHFNQPYLQLTKCRS